MVYQGGFKERLGLAAVKHLGGHFHSGQGHLRGTTWTLSLLEGYLLMSLQLCLFIYTLLRTQLSGGEWLAFGRAYFSSARSHPPTHKHARTRIYKTKKALADTTISANTIGTARTRPPYSNKKIIL